MSEKTTIKLKFNEKETDIQIFDTYQELLNFFYKYFSIDDETKKNISLFYFDEDGDKVSLKQETDYELLKRDKEQIKEIEGEILENDEDDSIDNQDPMKSGTIFKKVKEQSVEMGKNIENISLTNSYNSIESLNNAMVFPKKQNEKKDDFTKNINQVNNNIKLTLEENNKEKEI